MTNKTAFGFGLSENPDAESATAEAVRQVMGALGEKGTATGGPDLALLFVTPPHARHLEQMAGLVRSALSPATLMGCAAISVVGGRREIELDPAVSLWAGRTGPVNPFHLSWEPTPDGPSFIGWPDDPPEEASALLVLADPFSFPTEAFLARMAEDRPGLPIVGGMASAAHTAGGNRLMLDGEVYTEGAVCAYLGPGVEVATVVSQGCRPVGAPLVVTKAQSNVVFELAGRPALSRLQEAAAAADEDDRRLLASHVHFGRVINENKVQFERGDFLVRNLLGADPENGAIAVGEEVEVGATTQFQVRDAATADEDLRQLMEGRAADGALLFTCNGRGVSLFGAPDHDAEVVSESLAGAPVAGMFCAGELGPVGGRNFVHGFTASVVLLTAS